MSARPIGCLRARLVTAGLPLVLLAATAFVLDRPSLPREVEGRDRRAAVAIRDHVQPVEKLVTWAFVRPRLEAAYAEVRTVTEAAHFDDRALDSFLAALRELAAKYPAVDVWLLAHGNQFVEAIEDRLPRETTERIRLVYNSGCECGGQASRWLALGAQAYVAHGETAPHAPFGTLLLRRWLAGMPLGEAVEESNAQARRFLAAEAPFDGGWSSRTFAGSPGAIHGRSDLSLASPGSTSP